jgi:transcription antitermination factor NusG
VEDPALVASSRILFEPQAECAQVICSSGDSGGNIHSMKASPKTKLKDGAKCKVVNGTHAGKSGVVKDIKTSKTGHVTITVLQPNGERFKTLAKSIELF